MKTKVLLMLCASFLLSILFVSCEKQKEDEVLYGSMFNPYVILPKADYREYVQVGQKNGKITTYPGYKDSGAKGNNWQQLDNGYYYAEWLWVNGMFLDTKFSEYNAIWELYYTDEYKNKDILDTLNARILEKDPYIEIYEIINRSEFLMTKPTGQFMDDGREMYQIILNKDKLNKMLESGEFYTHESVKRIK